MRSGVIRKYRFLCTSILAFCLLSAPPAFAAKKESAQADLLISKIVQAHGGQEALAKVRSIYTRGYSKQFGQDNDGWVTRYVQRSGKLRVELGFHRSPGSRILNGEKAWAKAGAGPWKPADRGQYEGLLFQYNYTDLPFGLLDSGMTVVPKGKETLGNVTVDVLLLKKNGQELTVYSDETTNLISKISCTMNTGSRKTAASVEFLDYREVQGIKIPFKIYNSFGSSKASETALSEVVFDQPMDNKLFKP